MILKARNLAPGMLPTAEPTAPQLYTIELESPPEIDELITIAYNAPINPLLY